MAAELPVPVYTSLSDVYPDLVLAAKQGWVPLFRAHILSF